MNNDRPRFGANDSRAANGPGTGILHLGLGNFHRAHQAVYTAAALASEPGDWGILGVASRSHAVVNALHEQNLRYTVAEISPEGMSLSSPDVHTGAFVAAERPEKVVRLLSEPNVKITTLTVTENGYSFSAATGRLDVEHAAVAADLRGGTPKTTIGQLARGLQRRASGTGTPLTVLSCDNLAANGEHTKRLVTEFLELLPGNEGAEALAFIRESVTFPSSMVDRIVPATTATLRNDVARRLNAWDEITVPAEPFSMWAIEDRFAAGRPAWEAGGAIFTDEVWRYEQLKVRLLNGTHSLIAYLGALFGDATIPDAIARPEILEAARSVLAHEYIPSVEIPSGLDINAYERKLFERWGNTALGHTTSQVGTDGSVKLAQRIPEPAANVLDVGGVPHMIALTVAAYLACIAPLPGFDPGPHAKAMRDSSREVLSEFAASASTGEDLARDAIENLQLFGSDLASRPVLTSRVGELLDVLTKHGVSAALAEALAATNEATQSLTESRS